MKEIKLTVDGKEFPLTPEQIKSLGIDGGCVCDRFEECDVYYIVTDDCRAYPLIDNHNLVHNELYNSGNYYRNEDYAKQVALRQQLNNLLRRYSEQHGSDTPWNNSYKHFVIMFDTSLNTYIVTYYCVTKEIGTVYFKSQEVAEKAIEEVVKPFMKKHPDFVW